MLTPLEPLKLENGCEVTIEVVAIPAQASLPEGSESETLPGMIRRIREAVPDAAADGLPTDGAKNYKHYLYGHPKEED